MITAMKRLRTRKPQMRMKVVKKTKEKFDPQPVASPPNRPPVVAQQGGGIGNNVESWTYTSLDNLKENVETADFICNPTKRIWSSSRTIPNFTAV